MKTKIVLCFLMTAIALFMVGGTIYSFKTKQYGPAFMGCICLYVIIRDVIIDPTRKKKLK